MRGFDWGATEVNAWVALSYIYSLRANNAEIVWKSSEIPETIEKTNVVLDLLLKRQYDEGGWSAIEKTSNSKYQRTYSTIMAVWALAEANQNGDILKGHEAEYRAALTSGARWLLDAYTTSAEGFSGWWPNPSAKNPVGAYPGLQALALFVLSKAKASHSFIGADSRYKEAVNTFIKLAFDGNATLEPLTRRKISDNERVHDSDRYFPAQGGHKTAEASTFLWYPWTIALAATLEHDPTFLEYQHERLQNLLSRLLERADEENSFVRNDQAIYPTAEVLFVEGYYFSRDGLTVKQK
jgi:hypothetical protein